MKSNLHFQLHALFNPLSSEWQKTSYAEKRGLLEQIKKFIEKGSTINGK